MINVLNIICRTIQTKLEISSLDAGLLGVLGSMVVLFFGLISYGIYSAFGAGSKDLKDQIDEHARMHELGIAHNHGRRKDKAIQS